jgi:hypothetical protein
LNHRNDNTKPHETAGFGARQVVYCRSGSAFFHFPFSIFHFSLVIEILIEMLLSLNGQQNGELLLKVPMTNEK